MWLQSTGDPIIKLATSPKSAIPVRSRGPRSPAEAYMRGALIARNTFTIAFPMLHVCAENERNSSTAWNHEN